MRESRDVLLPRLLDTQADLPLPTGPAGQGHLPPPELPLYLLHPPSPSSFHPPLLDHTAGLTVS